MEKLKLSIILPCYNVEKYIAACLDSLYAQDIPETEYEVICVNDCSPDGTRNIILNYQNEHSNLRLIDHEVNKRQGGARNTGIKVAKGEYIWFVDPDDFVKTNCLNELIHTCELDKLDIYQFNYDKVSNTGEHLLSVKNVPDSNSVSGIEYTKAILGEEFLYKYDLPVMSRVHRTDFLISNRIFFIENAIFEDLEFSLRCLMYSQRIKSYSGSYYFYRQNPDSTMSIFSTIIKGDSIFQISILIGIGLIKLANDIKVQDNQLYLQLNESGVSRVNAFSRPLAKMNKKEREIFFKLALKNSLLVSSHYSYFTRMNRLILTFPFISEYVLSFISLVYKMKIRIKSMPLIILIV